MKAGHALAGIFVKEAQKLQPQLQVLAVNFVQNQSIVSQEIRPPETAHPSFSG